MDLDDDANETARMVKFSDFKKYDASKRFFHVFLRFLEVFCYNKMNKYRVPGPQNSRNYGIRSLACLE